VARVVDGYFGPKNINAAAAKRDPDSLWNFIAVLIQRYRESPELGWGQFELIDQPAANVLMHRCSRDGAALVLAHNFGAEPVSVTANAAPPDEQDRSYAGTVLQDLLDGEDIPLQDDGGFELELGHYGFRWFRIHHPEDRPSP